MYRDPDIGNSQVIGRSSGLTYDASFEMKAEAVIASILTLGSGQESAA